MNKCQVVRKNKLQTTHIHTEKFLFKTTYCVLMKNSYVYENLDNSRVYESLDWFLSDSKTQKTIYLKHLFQPEWFYDSMIKTGTEIKQAQKLAIAVQPRGSSVDVSLGAEKHLGVSLLQAQQEHWGDGWGIDCQRVYQKSYAGGKACTRQARSASAVGEDLPKHGKLLTL